MFFSAKKDFCPICNAKISLTNPKMKLENGDFICHECSLKMAGIWKSNQDELKKMSIDQIKTKYAEKGFDVFNPTIKIGTLNTYINFDDDNSMFSIKTNFLNPEYIGKFDELSSYEVISNDSVKVKSGLGKAAIGAVIAGPAGMITGAVIGKGNLGSEMINSLYINVFLKSNIVYSLEFISKPTKKNSLTVTSAEIMIKEIIGKLEQIIPEEHTENKIEEPPNHKDVFEEVKSYKELLDLGIITPEEFEIKKNNLLDI